MVQLTGWLVLDLPIGLSSPRTSSGRGSGCCATPRRDCCWIGPWPTEDQEVIFRVLSRYERQGIRFHAVRTRAAGQRRFVSMHVLVPGRWTVQQGHDLSEKIEGEVAEALPQSTFFIHIEPRKTRHPSKIKAWIGNAGIHRHKGTDRTGPSLAGRRRYSSYTLSTRRSKTTHPSCLVRPLPQSGQAPMIGSSRVSGRSSIR